MAPGPAQLPKTWSALDLGLYAFLAINPLALGLWTFSMAPLVGGNLLVAALLAGPLVVLGAIVFGSLAARWPVTGGEYVWQTRFLRPRAGAVLTLTSWWIAVAVLAPVYGNLFVVLVGDPILVQAGWEGVARWFHGRDGAFVASLVAIAFATGFVGLGMRRAAVAQRVLVCIGSAAFLALLVLMLTHTPQEFRSAFDRQAAEVYDAGGVASFQIIGVGGLDARANDVDLPQTIGLVPLVLLSALWIGWAAPLVGEVRTRSPLVFGAVLVRAALASIVATVVLFVAFARGTTWELWNEANNLYWGTIYDTTASTPLPTWPDPVVFASWLTDSTLVRIALIAGMGAWIVGSAATLFLGASRVLLAAGSDRLLPPSVSKTSGDTVPVIALALLVVPACVFAALDAYWGAFHRWTASAVLALAITMVGTAVAAVLALRGTARGMAAVAGLFAAIVLLVTVVWIADPVYGIRTAGSLGLLALFYAVVAACTWPRIRHDLPEPIVADED